MWIFLFCFYYKKGSAVAELLGMLLTNLIFFPILLWCQGSSVYSGTQNHIGDREATASVSRQKGESVANFRSSAIESYGLL